LKKETTNEIKGNFLLALEDQEAGYQMIEVQSCSSLQSSFCTLV
jgi:hypothetical protein